MAKVVALSGAQHKGLKVTPNCVVDAVKDQHIINIRVSEISKASACMPIFLNKFEGSSDWSVSTITSLELHKNLFVVEDKWSVNYVPNSMKAYPFFLVNGQKEGEFTIGIDEESNAFSKTDGADIFDSEGKSTPAMEAVIKLLEGDIGGRVHTKKFTDVLEEFDLIDPLTMRVQYEDGQVQTLTGLNSIDERKLQEMDDETFIKLRKTGFLAPIYALILSVFQLNELMKRHNQQAGVKQIVQVSMNPPEAKAEEKSVEKKTVAKKPKATAKKKVATKKKVAAKPEVKK